MESALIKIILPTSQDDLTDDGFMESFFFFFTWTANELSG